jgi:hypothetical protein
MVKFLGAICTLVAGLCLVGALDLAAARNLTGSAFLEDVAAASLDDPAARGQIVDEIVVWLDDQPARQAALEAALGEDWRGPLRDALVLAVQTEEFEAAYLESFDQVQEAGPGESVSVTVDLGPTVAAVSPQLEPDVAESIRQLPPGFFLASETIERDQLDDLDDFRQLSRQVLIWLTVIGVAAVILALLAIRSPLPLAWVGAIAVGIALVQLVLLEAIRDDVVAEQEDAIQRVGVDAVFDSLATSAVRPHLIVGIALVVVAFTADYARRRIRSDTQSGDMPTGSDTDWADPSRSDGFPKIIS